MTGLKVLNPNKLYLFWGIPGEHNFEEFQKTLEFSKFSLTPSPVSSGKVYINS